MEYIALFRRQPLVKIGDRVARGDLLTDGSAEIGEIFKYAGKEAAEEYIIKEVNRVYELNGASLPEHIEVIVRQMFSRKKIRWQAGDTRLLTAKG